MELKVSWSIFSQEEYINTLTYVYEEFGKKAAEELRSNVETWVKRIAANPEISAPEELLREESKLYRSKIVGKHNKLVYWHDSTTVYISDFWDMRRNPSKLAKRVKKE